MPGLRARVRAPVTVRSYILVARACTSCACSCARSRSFVLSHGTCWVFASTLASLSYVPVWIFDERSRSFVSSPRACSRTHSTLSPSLRPVRGVRACAGLRLPPAVRAPSLPAAALLSSHRPRPWLVALVTHRKRSHPTLWHGVGPPFPPPLA